MPIPPLVAIPASAAVPLAAQLSSRIADGLSFAQTLAERLGSQPRQEAPRIEAAGPTTLASSAVHAQRLATKSLQEFVEKFRRLAAAQEIDFSQPIELKSDGRQGVVVSNHRPDRAAIEQLFEQHPQLSTAFHRLSAAEQTLARFSDLSGQRFVGEFQLVLAGDATEVRFD